MAPPTAAPVDPPPDPLCAAADCWVTPPSCVTSLEASADAACVAASCVAVGSAAPDVAAACAVDAAAACMVEAVAAIVVGVVATCVAAVVVACVVVVDKSASKDVQIISMQKRQIKTDYWGASNI